MRFRAVVKAPALRGKPWTLLETFKSLALGSGHVKRKESFLFSNGPSHILWELLWGLVPLCKERRPHGLLRKELAPVG